MKHSTTSPLSLGVLISLIGVCVLSAAGQTGVSTPTPNAPSQQAAPPSQTPSPSASPSPVPSPRVTKVVSGHLELDNLIRVRVENLGAWADKEENDVTKLIPFVDGRAIRGNYPVEIHPTENHLQFHLQLTPENKDAWIDLLGAPRGTKTPVAFSVGLEGDEPFESAFHLNNPLPLTVISPVYGVLSLIIVVLTLGLLVWLARSTNLIRETGTCPVPGKLKPYNLGRTQMAFWFFLIYASYLTIWLITDALDTITGSLLALMGISGGTALAEAMIDSGKDQTQTSQLQAFSSEKLALEESIPELQSQITELNAKASLTPEDTANRDSLNKQLQDRRTRLAEVTLQVQALEPVAARMVSKGFIRDILSDASGYSFHRFQIFAWTIVLGIIFISSVYNSLNMPEFSATLLGLMGLSSGTYIGFKFPEQK
ncbi:MAG TPA: hypothetical protein VJM12_21460 [Pyrinomonadaceae bacterium]|nr:hypothetical protein [Pyrinomonadaceae bacterium]